MEPKFGDLIKQTQAMQSKLQEVQKKIEETIVTGIAGAGLVKVEMNGRHIIKKLHLDDNLFKQNKEIIKDLLCAAFNDGVKKIEDTSRNQMMSFTSNLDFLKANKNQEIEKDDSV